MRVCVCVCVCVCRYVGHCTDLSLFLCILLSFFFFFPLSLSLQSSLWKVRNYELSPVCAVVGGFVGQEILKIASHTGEPLQVCVFLMSRAMMHKKKQGSSQLSLELS
jgi:hypothetical protein